MPKPKVWIVVLFYWLLVHCIIHLNDKLKCIYKCIPYSTLLFM